MRKGKSKSMIDKRENGSFYLKNSPSSGGEMMKGFGGSKERERACKAGALGEGWRVRKENMNGPSKEKMFSKNLGTLWETEGEESGFPGKGNRGNKLSRKWKNKNWRSL